MSYSALNVENSNLANKNQHVRFQVEKADVSVTISNKSSNENGRILITLIKNKIQFRSIEKMIVFV